MPRKKSNLHNRNSRTARRLRLNKTRQSAVQIEDSNAAQRIRTTENCIDQSGENTRQNRLRTRAARDQHIARHRAPEQQQDNSEKQQTSRTFKSESTSVNPDVLANLELKLTTLDSASGQEMAIKEEPKSEPEENEASGYQNVYDPSTVTDTVPSVRSVISHSERSGGEILGVPVGVVPGLPGAPPSQSLSGGNHSATNGVLKKNWLQPNLDSVNEYGGETRTIKEEPMSEPEENKASGYQNVYDPSTVTVTVSRLAASTVIVPSVLSIKSNSERSGEILGLPVGEVPRHPGAPPSQSVSGGNCNATNGVPKKNRLHSNLDSVNEYGEVTKVLPEYRTRDQFDVFGEYIASKIRRLDWRTCAHVQKAVKDIISQAEMGNYNQVNKSCS